MDEHTGLQANSTEAVTPATYNYYRSGVGHWGALDFPIDRIYSAAERWRATTAGIDRLWLCWNVDPDWCLVQQRLVTEIGWTPLVGCDPRVGKPKLLSKSLFIDFNADFRLPTMWMHFPLEFAFLFAQRLAFWHSDLLVRLEKLRQLAALFERLDDGTMAAVQPKRGISNIFRLKGDRYWELIGCTTTGASLSQFQHGSGWWCGFSAHINCKNETERERRQKYYWDHGVGIKYWKKNYGGVVVQIPERYVAEGHCSRIGNATYERVSPDDATRYLAVDLRHNYNLAQVCHCLGLERFLLDEEKPTATNDPRT